MSDSQLATASPTPGFHKATSQLSTTLGIEPRMMVDTLKKQCFPGMSADSVSDAQLAAFVSVANAMDLNPLIPGMLYAYPGKNGGIVPVTGPDGVLKKLDEEITKGKIDGYECDVFPEDVTVPPTHAVAKIYRKGTEHPAKFTAIFKEWSVSSNGNWGSRPRHMIWLRALKQCARQVIHGVPYDEDDVKIGDMVNVTPDAPPPEQQKRADAPPRKLRGASAVTAPTTTVAEERAAQSGQKIVDSTITEVAATPVAETKVEPAKVEAKADKPAIEPVPAPEPGLVRAFLKDKEEYTAICVVVKSDGLMANVKDDAGNSIPTPSVSAEVKGGFTGTVHHFGGGEEKDGDIKPLPMWAPGKTVKLHLLGKLLKSGKILATVQATTEVSPTSSAMETE